MLLGLLRQYRTVAGWTFALGMLVLAVDSLLTGFSINHNTSIEDVLYWQRLRLTVLALLPGPWLLFSISYARGDLDKTPRVWIAAVVAAFAVPIGGVLLFSEELTHRILIQANAYISLGKFGTILIGLILVSSVLIAMNLERTYRASVGTIRWRIKFTLIGVGVIFIVRIYSTSQCLLFHGIDPAIEAVNSGALVLSFPLFLRSFLRDTRLSFGVYPSQSILQNSLTALLAGIYLLVVGVFGKIASLFGGDSTFAFKAFLTLVALVTLALFLQSDLVRLKLRRFVSRNFKRPQYDYREVWTKFTEGTGACVEQGELARALVRLLADTFQALSVSIWIVDARNESLAPAASTSLSSESATKSAQVSKMQLESLAEYFISNQDPADFETEPAAWGELLRNLHPAEFIRGGNRICVPIVARKEFLGLILIGDRVGGVPFSVEDLEMLKCACNHASASLINVQLAQKLVQAKEFEAFQTMAAFFVHDLKNAASTLNLMFQNLPDHFEDPAFREDALRGIGKTVTHVNHLIGRLGMLRHELKISPADTDVSVLVENSLAGLESDSKITVSKHLGSFPKLSIDRDQIGKVVTNLVLNAREAILDSGEVIISTHATAQNVIIKVTDTGCGMSADFIKRSLFRPFQTTKKNGLGIGMFQSKMIVEAHGGRLAAESVPGRGTTFTIMLPIRGIDDQPEK